MSTSVHLNGVVRGEHRLLSGAVKYSTLLKQPRELVSGAISGIVSGVIPRLFRVNVSKYLQQMLFEHIFHDVQRRLGVVRGFA